MGPLARAWAHRRLRRGRCPVCARVLPDDRRPGPCGPACDLEDWMNTQW